MILDIASPSIIDGVDNDDMIFIVIAAIILICMISIVIYKKVKKGRKLKNEKY